ncbi:MAG: hypothetical protein Q6K70_08970, partial [Thermostichales cyanobacterium DRC_bins_46]
HLWQRAGERWGDPGSYVGIRQSHVQGYTLYHQGIELETDQGRMEIARLSPLVQALTRIEPQTWLIFPKELGADVQEFLA